MSNLWNILSYISDLGISWKNHSFFFLNNCWEKLNFGFHSIVNFTTILHYTHIWTWSNFCPQKAALSSSTEIFKPALFRIACHSPVRKRVAWNKCWNFLTPRWRREINRRWRIMHRFTDTYKFFKVHSAAKVGENSAILSIGIWYFVMRWLQYPHNLKW